MKVVLKKSQVVESTGNFVCEYIHILVPSEKKADPQLESISSWVPVPAPSISFNDSAVVLVPFTVCDEIVNPLNVKIRIWCCLLPQRRQANFVVDIFVSLRIPGCGQLPI